MHHRDFDLGSLEVFVAVAELGSMTRAAGRLGLTQSAVSHVVRQLETAFATQLLDILTSNRERFARGPKARAWRSWPACAPQWF